jgi:predicted permease
VSDEIDREMAFHLAERADDLVAGGMSPDAARREARRRFGNYALQKEDTRDHDLLGWLETTGADVRYAMRACRRAPGFAGVAILSLALGIGANTAIFTLINVAMLKSLPVSRPEDLVRVTLNLQREPSKRDPGAKSESCCTQGVWERIRDHHDTFASVFAYGATSGADLSTGGESRPVIVGLVTGGFFSTLGMRPAAGRILVDTDDRPNCPPVAVISHGFWHSEFGGSPTTVGQSVTLNGRPFEIVGVADRSFFGVEFGFSPRIWAPQCAGTAIRGGYQGGGWVVGRLKPGLTFEQGAAMLASLAPPDSAFALEPFAHGIPFLSGLYGQALFVLMAIVGIVLLVACANIANLLLARATARQREIAVRLALGASRFRLVRQLLTESLVLSLAGAGLGLLFAMWGSRALVGLFPNIDPPDLTPDATVLAFTLGVCALTSVLFGLAPAGLLFAPRKSQAVDPHLLIKSGGRTLGEGPSRFSIAKTLVVAQIALSLVMVIGAGLLVTTWQQLVAIDPGFRSDGVLLASVNTRPARLPRNQLGPTYTRILDDLRAMLGVVSASAAWVPPFTANSRLAIDVAGFTPAMPGDAVVRLNQISDGYFRTLRTPLLAGRDFGPTDVPTSPSVAIVNEALARKFFGVADVVGRTFRVKEGAGLSEPVQIVGVAGNTKWMTLREESQAIVYYALGQAQPEGISFVLRGEGAASALAPGVKSVLAAADPRFSLTLVPLQQRIDNSIRLPRVLALLSGFFGALALLLAMIGLYGVVSYSVARRRSEIGVRIALGAERTAVIGMVLKDVSRLVAAGVVIGLLFSVAGTRLVKTFLYGVTPTDPSTLALSSLALIGVAIGAGIVPAWRASRLDPVSALREE